MVASNTLLMPELQKLNQQLRLLDAAARGEETIAVNDDSMLNKPLLSSHLRFLRHQKGKLLEKWQLKYLWVNISQLQETLIAEQNLGSAMGDDLRTLTVHTAKLIPDEMFEYNQRVKELEQTQGSVKAKESALAEFKEKLYHELLQVTSIELIEQRINTQALQQNGTVEAVDEAIFTDEFNRQLLLNGATLEFEYLSVMRKHQQLCEEASHDPAFNAISASHNQKLKELLSKRTHRHDVLNLFDASKALNLFLSETGLQLCGGHEEAISDAFFETQILSPDSWDVERHGKTYYYHQQAATAYDFKRKDGSTVSKLQRVSSGIASDTKRQLNQGRSFGGEPHFPLYAIIDKELLKQLSGTPIHYLSVSDFFNSHHFENLSAFLQKTFQTTKTFLHQPISSIKQCRLPHLKKVKLPFHDQACDIIEKYLRYLDNDDAKLGQFQDEHSKKLRRHTTNQLKAYIEQTSEDLDALDTNLRKLVKQYKACHTAHTKIDKQLHSKLDDAVAAIEKAPLTASDAIDKALSLTSTAHKVLERAVPIDYLITSYNPETKKILQQLKLLQLLKKYKDMTIESIASHDLPFICDVLNISQDKLKTDSLVVVHEHQLLCDQLRAVDLSFEDVKEFDPSLYGYSTNLLNSMERCLNRRQDLIKDSRKTCFQYIETIKANKPHFYEFKFIETLRKLFSNIINAFGFFCCSKSDSDESTPLLTVSHSSFFKDAKRLLRTEPISSDKGIELSSMSTRPQPKQDLSKVVASV